MIKNIFIKKLFFGMLLAGIIGGSLWLYCNFVYSIPIKDVLENPRQYDGKILTISGEVTDRVSLLSLKFFKLKDKSGEIIVISSKAPPAIGASLRVKGEVKEAFAIGKNELIVFVEENNSEK